MPRPREVDLRLVPTVLEERARGVPWKVICAEHGFSRATWWRAIQEMDGQDRDEQKCFETSPVLKG